MLQDEIVHNARDGAGPCEGCPCQLDTGGALVNPGMIDPEADIVFLTMDPSHYTDWERYDSWAEYNAAKTEMFVERAPGGAAISRILDGVPGVSVEDVWLADAIKCPANNDRAGDVDASEAFEHCAGYLRREIEDVDPEVVVTMGNDPAEQLLDGIYGLGVGTVNAGSTNAGDVHWVSPPVVVSPHWSNGWLGRHGNRRKVRNSILEVLRR